MNDLKDALERRSERFDLEPGAMDRFFLRRERRERRQRIAAICLVAVVAGVGAILAVRAMTGGSGETRPAVSGPEGATHASGFPEGSFEHVATVEEAVANGFTEQEASEAFGPDGELPMTFVFDAGTFQHITVDDDGVSEVGDSGSYTVEGDTVTMVSASVGCNGCVTVYRWTYEGDVLSLVLESDSAGPEDARDVRLHTEYDFRKVS